MAQAIDEGTAERLKSLLIDMMEGKDWNSMTNDIERYQKIKELVINAFEAVLVLSPHQVRVFIQEKIDRLKGYDFIFEFEELETFLKFVGIITTGLLSNLDEKGIADYAAPHEAVGKLDSLVRINEKGIYSEANVGMLGAAMTVELHGLKARLEKIDWKKGWADTENNDDHDYD